MTHDTTSQDNHPVSRDIGQEVLRAIASIQFGSIEIIIHEGQVMRSSVGKKSASLLRTTFASPNNALPHQPVRITSTRQLENKN